MSPVAPAAAAVALGATPMSIDERGVPRLLQGSALMPAIPAATATASARAHVARLAPAWGVRTDSVPALEALGEAPVATAKGATMVRFRQVIDGLPIDRNVGGELHVLVGNDGALIAASGSLFSTETPHPSKIAFVDDDAAAVARAVSDHHQTVLAPAALAMASQASDGTRMLAGQAGGITVSMSRARKAWSGDAGGLTPAWIVEAYSSNGKSTDGDAYRTVIASDGRVLSRVDLKDDVAFKYRVFAETTGELHPFDGPIADITPSATGVPNTTPYPPYVLPNLLSIEGLNHPPGTTRPDPWIPAGFTETKGNNVEAYTDINPPDGLTFGDFRAVVTAPGTFDRTYNTAAGSLSSQGQMMAGITSLFYLINWMHDFWYDAGFVEANGNAQNANFGRGGEDRDAILAEAQDNANGGSRNNANMSTPDDGMPPRMQVFVWDGADDRSLGIGRRKPATGPAAFGSKNFTITAAVVLGDDGTAPGSDACQAFATPVTGKIVVVDRGACSFKTKALNVQNAGGVAMILADNAPGVSPPSLGEDATITTPITIGTLSVTQASGVLIKGDLAAGPISATAHRVVGPDLEGTLDATVVTHEFGHYVHHRLSVCNTTLCGAMSEGWADFDALLVVSRAGDNFSGAFPVGTYSTQSFPADPVYYGIRRAPYSNNHAINPLSFRHMAQGEPLPPPPFNGGAPSGNNEVHASGEVWASMLWEGYSALQQQPGATFEAVRLKMRQYVIAGLQLAPVDATPTETRDSILAAVHAMNPADHDVLAAAYARRGFGSCAVSPPRTSTTFVGIVENFDVKGRLAAGTPVMTSVTSCDSDDVLDGGETARITVPVSNPGAAALADTTITLASTTPGIHITSPTVAVGALAAYGATSVAFDVQLDDTVTTALSGDFTVTLAASNGCAPSVGVPFSVRLNTDDSPNSSATDSFNAGGSVWTASGTAGIWAHERKTALEAEWHGIDGGGPSDGLLTSPLLTATSDPITITFQHKFSFEFSGTSAFDGGVIEYSTDGATWQDISGIASPGYNTTLVGDPGTSGNLLAGRPAYGHNNPAFPNTDTVTLNLGTALAGKTFRIRFHEGSDTNTGAPGWEIDNVAFTGIAGTPFPTLITDTGECETAPDAAVPPPPDASLPAPDAPSAPPYDGGLPSPPPDACGNPGYPPPGPPYPPGGGGCQTGGAGAGLGAAFALLAVLVRRRRR